jgi:hypothetical protein
MDDGTRDRTVLHASDIYNDYYAQANPKRYGHKDDGHDPDMLFAEGLAWEQYFEKALLARGVECFRPDTMQVEWKGHIIKYSPDLILVNAATVFTKLKGDNRDRIGEIKKAWKSSRLKPTDKDFAKYLSQGKLYAGWAEIPRVTWFIDHTVGNWRDYPLPTMRVWHIEFTKRELQDEMKTMMQHAEDEDLFAKAEAGLLRNPAPLPQGIAKRDARDKRKRA